MGQAKALVVCAIKPEFLEIRKFLLELDEDLHPDGDIYERGKFVAEKNIVWDVLLARSGAGNASAALCTERAIAYFGPDVVLFIGVAGGVKDVQMFDVVAAESVYGYEGGKADEQFKPRAPVGLASFSLSERAHAESAKDRWRDRIKNPDAPSSNDVYVGKIVAGEKVVSSERSTTYKLIRKHFSDALAVEMEASGFYEAVHRSELRKVRGLVIRGISDMIVNKEEADKLGSQRKASALAAAFGFEVLSRIEPTESQPIAAARGSDVAIAFRSGTLFEKQSGKNRPERPSVQDYLERAKQQHPKFGDFPLFHDPTEAYTYNQRLDQYYKDEQQYIKDVHDFDERCTRTVAIELVVSNSGKMIASQLEIVLTVNASLTFKLVPPSEPFKPEPPPRPRNQITGGFGQHQDDADHWSAVGQLTTLMYPHSADKKAPKWKLNGERKAEITIARLMHNGVAQPLPMIWLEGQTPGDQKLSIEYMLIDVNADGPVRGSLSVELSSSIEEEIDGEERAK